METLLELLAESDSLSPRRLGNLVYFLGRLSDPASRIPLEEMLSDPAESLSTGMQVSLIRALGSISEASSLAVLLPLAADSSSRVRRQLSVTLGEIGDPAALPVLEELLNDPGIDVMSAASRAMELIEEAMAEEHNEEVPEE